MTWSPTKGWVSFFFPASCGHRLTLSQPWMAAGGWKCPAQGTALWDGVCWPSSVPELRQDLSVLPGQWLQPELLMSWHLEGLLSIQGLFSTWGWVTCWNVCQDWKQHQPISSLLPESSTSLLKNPGCCTENSPPIRVKWDCYKNNSCLGNNHNAWLSYWQIMVVWVYPQEASRSEKLDLV